MLLIELLFNLFPNLKTVGKGEIQNCHLKSVSIWQSLKFVICDWNIKILIQERQKTFWEDYYYIRTIFSRLVSKLKSRFFFISSFFYFCFCSETIICFPPYIFCFSYQWSIPFTFHWGGISLYFKVTKTIPETNNKLFCCIRTGGIFPYRWITNTALVNSFPNTSGHSSVGRV